MLYGMSTIRTKKLYRSSVETKHVQKNGQGIAKWLDFVQNPSILACLQFENDIQSYIYHNNTNTDSILWRATHFYVNSFFTFNGLFNAETAR